LSGIEFLVKNQTVFKKITSSLRSTWRILHKSIRPEKRIQGSLKDIIHIIHQERFSPEQPYCITGGHFRDLYVRNSGIFYNALLDPRIALDERDWNNRVEIAIRTTETILWWLRACGKMYTTFTVKKKRNIEGANYYAEPSDSLYALLWNFRVFQEDTYITDIFPTAETQSRFYITPSQKERMEALKNMYQKDIESEFRRYSQYCLSHRNHRISKKVQLASARDGVKRRSSFYDNVIYWKTAHMMHFLWLYTSISRKKLHKIKTTILANFWDSERGIFLDDLSKNSLTNRYFCADTLIALSTRFLRVEMPEEREYLVKIVDYIQSHHLDVPFWVHYSEERTHRHWPVIVWAPHYADYTIWSHWSTEYIKLLILLGYHDPVRKDEYLTKAGYHLQALEEKMLQYGGYPEVYDLKGQIYKSRLYRSVLRCSWVVGYEQAKYMLSKCLI
jgi:hypothetical protein